VLCFEKWGARPASPRRSWLEKATLGGRIGEGKTHRGAYTLTKKPLGTKEAAPVFSRPGIKKRGREKKICEGGKQTPINSVQFSGGWTARVNPKISRGGARKKKARLTGGERANPGTASTSRRPEQDHCGGQHERPTKSLKQDPQTRKEKEGRPDHVFCDTQNKDWDCMKHGVMDTGCRLFKKPWGDKQRKKKKIGENKKSRAKTNLPLKKGENCRLGNPRPPRETPHIKKPLSVKRVRGGHGLQRVAWWRGKPHRQMENCCRGGLRPQFQEET